MSPKPRADKGAAQDGEAPDAAQADTSGPVRKRAVRRPPVTVGAQIAEASPASGTDEQAAVAVVAVTGVEGVPAAQAEYWEDACAELMARDRIMRKLIPGHGTVRLESRGEPFTTLARSIVGQQISVKAAQTVWDRLQLACPDFAPTTVLALPLEGLAACGLSRRKAEYIRDLASHFDAGALHVTRWSEMDDEAVIGELTQIRGIGRWTAEMFLIFNQLRPNVLPLDDIGLLRAISLSYFSGEPVTRSEAREVASNWEPWRTVATWYLWRSLDPIPVEY